MLHEGTDSPEAVKKRTTTDSAKLTLEKRVGVCWAEETERCLGQFGGWWEVGMAAWPPRERGWAMRSES